jgi:phage terminase small subunit
MAKKQVPSKMTTDDRYRLFATEYVIDFNGTRAAIDAGYSKNGAATTASRLLRNPNIQTYIAEAIERRQKKAEVDAQYVLNRLVEIDHMDVADIVHDDGTVKPIKEWPTVWRRTLSALDVSTLYSEMDGETIIKKIKWPDKVKNLELLGKHVNVQAFKDQVEHSADDGLLEALKRGRKRSGKE